MYSALPTKLISRGTVSMRNAESRNEMWFGHKIAGPSTGSRWYPAVSMCHSLRAIGDTARRVLRWRAPFAECLPDNIIGVYPAAGRLSTIGVRNHWMEGAGPVSTAIALSLIAISHSEVL